MVKYLFIYRGICWLDFVSIEIKQLLYYVLYAGFITYDIKTCILFPDTI